MKNDSEKTRAELLQELHEARTQIEELQVFASLVTNIRKAVPDRLYLINEDGDYLGRGDEIGNNEHSELFHDNLPSTEEMRSLQKKSIENALETGETQLFEFSIITPDGEKWFERRISPMTPREQRKRELIQITRDITERKEFIEKLRRSERTYRTVVESIPERIVLKDTNHTFVSSNSLFASFFGKTPEEIYGMHNDELYPPDLAKRLYETDNQVMQTGETLVFTNTLDTEDGEIVFEGTKSPVRDHDGNIAGNITIIKDITEQKKTEEALRFSDAALKSIHECVYAMDNDYRITYWNHICEDLFGIKAADAIGKFIGDIMQMKEEYPGQNQERFDLLIEKGHNQEEQIWITPRGNIWVDVFAQAIEQDGKRYGWITLANDITERKKVEESLRESEERFSTAFRSVPDSIVISRLEDGLYLEVNDSFVELTGYSREEIIGNVADKLGVWVNRNDRLKVLSIIKEKGRVENYEHEFRKKSGEMGTGLITVEPLDIGGVRCMISVITDITERKKAEEQLRYQASLVDNVTEAIISHDENLKILSFNKAAERIFQVSKDEVIGKDIRDLCRIEPVDGTMQDIRDSVQQKGFWRGEAIHHLNSGISIHMRISTIVVEGNNKGKPSYVLIMSDVTEEKKAERELKQHYEREIELRQEIENEMKKRTEFSAAIVHELKTPLTAIISSSDLFVETAEEGPLKRLARNINLSAYELDKRTNELLDMTKGELGILNIEPKPLDFYEMIKSMEIDFVTLLSRKKQTFILDLPESLPKIKGDESRLRQVIFNLINNAVKYTGEGGTITFAVTANTADVKVEIRDTGSGLSVKEQEYVFEPYQQLIEGKRAEGGMGLGLAIARNIITVHGGKIWVESRKGKGSSFCFTLPLNRAVGKKKLRK
ncbi:MAG: PAS domain S-box protein [Dehalococcoidales bacterium]|nr:PAS domain S-box protein [Dehalococcoidales bacterium]